jgi:Ca2+-transporting ATPase
VHLAVPGRARLRVAGLCGNGELKRALEVELLARRGILSARASTITGNALVVFELSMSTRKLIRLVREVLAELPRRRRGGANGSPAQDWHRLEPGAVLTHFGVTKSAGLSRAVAKALRDKHGPNLLPVAPPRSDAEIFLQQFRSLPVALLGVSAALSLATGGLADALVIGAVVLMNAAIGFFTESHAERTISELAKIVKEQAIVIREGKPMAIEPADVVPGDILVLLPGSAVPADARIVEATRLNVDESALTGESVPVAKSAAALERAGVVLAERVNMVYRGTVVTGGSALAVVVGTGRATELGHIEALVSETRTPQTPMQKQLDDLSRQLVLLSAPVCAGLFAIGLVRGQGVLPMLKSSIALFVAAIPEGLPTVATTILALGLKQVRSQKVLVRRLNAIEALGSVQAVCLDKTGTLTVNRMSVVEVACATQRYRAESGFAADASEVLRRLICVAVLCNDTEIRGGNGTARMLSGSATENALVELGFAADLDVAALRALRPRLRTEYRTEQRAYMATVHRAEDLYLIAVKGNPAEVLQLCSTRCVDDAVQPLTDEDRNAIRAENDRMAGSGLRVLAMAYRFAREPGEEARELVWLGLVGMADPVREGAREVVASLHRAGVHTAMITGDQSATAYAVGTALDLSAGEPLEVLDALRLDQADEALLAALAPRAHVFARVSPSQKLKIVQALQRAGRVVAMTGDGINDGPALKTADIGIAMGRAGTEVARSVADIILEDDELASLLAAIRQGRATYDNVRKSIHFLLATNMSEMQVMLAATALGFASPLNPIQLLWINLMSDVLPALALALEPPAPDILERAPRDPAAAVASLSDFKRLGVQAAMITAGTLGAYGLARLRHGPGAAAGSTAFTTLTCAQLLHTLSARSSDHGLFLPGRLRANHYLSGALGASFALQGIAAMVPAMRRLLGLTPLTLADVAVSAAGTVLPYLGNEALKGFQRRRTT